MNRIITRNIKINIIRTMITETVQIMIGITRGKYNEDYDEV